MRKVITPKLRFQVLNRDNFTCQYCGLKACDGVQLQIDHKISVKNGGENTIDNLITSCFKCNIGKGKNNLEEVTKKIYETKISDNIGTHILQFYKWWNYKNFGNIDNNTKALLNIYIGCNLGGDNYMPRLDCPPLVKQYLGKENNELTPGDIGILCNLFKEGGDYCSDVLSFMEGPFGPFGELLNNKDIFELYGEDYTLEQLTDDKIWNGICQDSYNNRLNYLLTELLIDCHYDGKLKNDYSIKKFSYFYNQIICHKE